MAHQPVIGTLNWIMMLIYTFYDTIKYPNVLIHINQLIKSNMKHFPLLLNEHCSYYMSLKKQSQQLEFEDFSA